MCGIIYKDVCLFFRTVDKWGLLTCGGLVILFTALGGVYGGILVSTGLGILVGMLHLLALEKETKTDWGLYQRILPLSGGKVVAGKYTAVLLTALAGAVGAVLFNLAFFAAYGRFVPLELGLSVLMATAVPLVWAAIVLPVYYWFGFPAAQFVNMLPLLVVCGLFDRIGDGGVGWVPALLSIIETVQWLPGLPALAGVFWISLVVSVMGYCRRY